MTKARRDVEDLCRDLVDMTPSRFAVVGSETCLDLEQLPASLTHVTDRSAVTLGAEAGRSVNMNHDLAPSVLTSGLDACTAPWVRVQAVTAAHYAWTLEHLYSDLGTHTMLRMLRGRKMRTVESLMSEVGAALQLSDSFGENWPALEESLCYLDEHLPAERYVVVISHAQDLLSREARELSTFYRLLDRVARWWAEPVGNSRFSRSRVPFHTILWLDQGTDLRESPPP